MGVYAATTAIIAGTVLSAAGQMQAASATKAAGQAQQQAAEYNAKATEQAAEYRAKSAEVKAGQERAVAQRNAIAERRHRDLTLSRAQALSAASGAGALDPTVVNIESGIIREGELGALSQMYMGEESARGLEESAGLARYEASLAGTGLRYEGAAAAAGANARARAARLSAAGTFFGGMAEAGSFYMKYNPASGAGPDWRNYYPADAGPTFGPYGKNGLRPY